MGCRGARPEAGAGMGGDNQAGSLRQAARHPGAPCRRSMPVSSYEAQTLSCRQAWLAVCLLGSPCGLLAWLVTSLCLGCTV